MISTHSKKEVQKRREVHPVLEIKQMEPDEIFYRKIHYGFSDMLSEKNFEPVTDKEIFYTDKIKEIIIEMIYNADDLPSVKYSSYLSKKIGVNYTYLSKLFSKITNITIEHFIIAHKIERVKYLLVHAGFTLSEIAWRLHYSSTAHLSAQFKKVTGLTPSSFKKAQPKERLPESE